MTQKKKKLLFKDLCGRLPYDVKVKIPSMESPLTVLSINTNGVTWVKGDTGYPFEIDWENCKPYLFPMSSMTEKEYSKWDNTYFHYLISSTEVNYPESENYLALAHLNSVEWLYKHHYDIYGLIPMGLGIDATDKNIY